MPNSKAYDTQKIKRQKTVDSIDVIGFFRRHGIELEPGSNGWSKPFQCPEHDDKSPSANVKLKSAGDGERGYFNCFGCKASKSIFDIEAENTGCSFTEALDRLAMEAGVNEAPTPRRTSKPFTLNGRKATESYEYTDESGKLLYYNLRFDKPKAFRPADAAGIIRTGLFDKFPEVPFRLPEILNVDLLFIVEGEKDANNLCERDLAATTRHGAQASKPWPEGFAERYFKDKNVVIIPDGDDAGKKKAAAAAAAIYKIRTKPGITLKVLKPLGTAEGYDVSNFFEAGNTIDDLGKIVKETPLYTPPPDEETAKDEPTPTIKYTTLAVVGAEEYEDEPTIDRLIYSGESLMVDAPGGLGKSGLLHFLALSGGAFTPPITPQDRTLFLDTFEIKKPTLTVLFQSENQRKIMSIRQRLMVKGNPDLQPGASRIIVPEINDDIVLIGKYIENPGTQQYIKDFLNRIEDDYNAPVDMFILDPLVSYHESDENGNTQMRRVLDLFQDTLKGRETTFIFAHHDAKNAEKQIFRGATAIWDFARNVIHMEAAKIGDLDAIKLEHVKCNNRRAFDTIHVRRDEFLNFKLIEDADALNTKQKKRYRGLARIFDDLKKPFLTHNQLSKAYEETFGITKATAKRHIAEALFYNFIGRVADPDPGTQTQFLYTKIG